MKKLPFSVTALFFFILGLSTGKMVKADFVVGTVPAGTLPAFVAINPITNKIYVSNFNSANVTVIDGTDNSTATVAVGATPRDMAVNPITNKIYVPNRDSNTVTVINGADNSTATVAVGSQPSGIGVNTVTNKIYVANSAFNTPSDVTVIDGATNSTTTIPIGLTINLLAVNETTNKIYVGTRANHSVVVIDGTNNSTTTVGVGADGTTTDFIAVNTGTNKVYVVNRDNAPPNATSVTVIDGMDNSTTTVATGGLGSAGGLGVNLVTNKTYITNYSTANVTIIDGTNNSFVTIPAWANPSGVAVNSTTNKIYVANRGSNNVMVIDGTNNSTKTVLTDRLPGTVAVNPVTNKIFVCNAGSNNVTVIDGTSMPTPTPAPMPAGLVSRWTGDGNADDTIGGNNGTLVNGATYTTGVLGQAFAFDGIDDYLQAPTIGLPNGNSDRTLTMWVRIDAPVANESFFGGYGKFGELTHTYSLGASGSFNGLFFSQWGAGVSGPRLQNGHWYHVAVTNTGNQATLYLDGNAGAGVLTIATSPDSQFYLGTIPGTNGSIRRLQGAVDDVRFYNRALSDLEIQSVFNERSFSGTPTPTPSPTITPTPTPTVTPSPSPTPPAAVSVSGRVTTPAGLGLRNAVVLLTNSQGVRQTATTSSFGFYSFENVVTGETYVIGVSSKRYRFASRNLLVNDNLTNVDFVGLE